MTDKPKKSPATILYRSEQAIVAIKKNPDGSGDLISGKVVKEGEALTPGTSLHEVNYADRTIETIYEPPAPAREGGGPAKVSSPSFREGYEAIFGQSKREQDLLN